MFAKAPILTWLLTALTCFLAGMAVVEARHQAAAPPTVPPPAVVVTVEVAYLPTATPEPTPQPPPTPTPTPACDPSAPAAPRFGCTGNVR